MLINPAAQNPYIHYNKPHQPAFALNPPNIVNLLRVIARAKEDLELIGQLECPGRLLPIVRERRADMAELASERLYELLPQDRYKDLFPR